MNLFEPMAAVECAHPDPPARSISSYALILAALLSLAFIALNHDFDVVGGRFEDAVTSGGGLDQQAGVEQNVGRVDIGRKLGLLMVLAVGALALLGPARDVRLRLDAVTCLAIAALCWTAASWFWSASRQGTTVELVRLFAYTFTAAALVRRFRVHELLFMLLVVSLASIAVDISADMAAGTFRPWTRDFRLGGTLHPNHMGRLGAIVALIGCAAFNEPRLRKWSWVLLSFGLLVLIMSKSRSGLMGFAAGLMAIYLIGLSRRRLSLGAASVAASAAAAALVYAALPPSAHRQVTNALLMGRTEDAGSLTGRLPLWQEMWRDSAGRRWPGHGYGAYWTVDRNYDIASAIEWFPHHSHSAYVELFIDLGFVGLALVIALAIASIARCAWLAATTGRADYRLMGGLMVCGLANGFFEVGFSTPRFEGLFMGIAVLVLALRPPEAEHAPRELRRMSLYSQVWPRSLALRAQDHSRRE